MIVCLVVRIFLSKCTPIPPTVPALLVKTNLYEANSPPNLTEHFIVAPLLFDYGKPCSNGGHFTITLSIVLRIAIQGEVGALKALPRPIVPGGENSAQRLG